MADKMNATIAEVKDIAARLRKRSIEMTTKAGSGHPSSCMSAADIVAMLFFRVMKYDAANPISEESDKFVLSKGHAAPVLYAALVEAGTITEAETMTLRQIDSRIEGHPTPRFPWVQIATGSLGQGLSAGAGMAAGIKRLNPKSGRRVYVVLGDGEVAEGAVWEAAAFASHYKLDNLTAIVDVNRLGQSEPTMLQHDVKTHAARFEAFGWNAIIVDGHDLNALDAAFEQALATTGKPSVLIAKTFKGHGVSFMNDKDNFHGKPLSKEDAAKAVAELNVVDQTPPKITPVMPKVHTLKVKGIEPPAYKKGDKVATREAYGTALVKLGKACPEVVALDGDVKNSTFSIHFAKAFPERFFECYIAEQNMVGAAMGLAAENFVPFASTFAAFLMRAADQIRMAGISQSNIKLCGSHAGVSIGEDGPSQMALEELGLFRSVPGSIVLYPADAVATEKLVVAAAEYNGMAFIRTGRPKCPVIYDNDEEFPLGQLKVVRQSASDAIAIAGAGVTLFEALAAAEKLAQSGISARVIDLYSVKPFPAAALLENARAAGNKLLVVEDHYAAGGLGEAAASALGTSGVDVHSLAVETLPRSGKAEELLAYSGIDAASIAHKVEQILR